MASDLADLQAAIDALVDDAVTIVAVNAVSNLKDATPVDTGHARGNWQTTIGAPADHEQPAPPDAPDAAVVLAGYTAAQGSVHVTNPVPYIGRLDAGHSQQAPAGFVRVAVEAAVLEAEQILQRRASGRGRGRK